MRIAVVDDEPIVRKRLSAELSKDGSSVDTYGTGEALLEDLESKLFDLVVLDVVLPGMNGTEVLRKIKESSPDTEIILITGYASIDSAIEAVKAGAFYYLSKPLRLADVRHLARQALEYRRVLRENSQLKAQLDPIEGWGEMVGGGNSMKDIFLAIRKVAPLDCSIIIQGESGTGKELVARAIHRQSARKDRPFVAFNCAGFTEELIASELFGYERGAFTGATMTKIGILETAHRGTVLMDEIADMPLTMQAKLLRVIQEKQILRVGGSRPISLDLRFLAASNKDLKRAVGDGRFREDLYFRLNVVKIELPRLRDRKEDIPLLINYFFSRYNGKFRKNLAGIHPQAREILLNYTYPGNVRELENIIERAVALAERDMVMTDDLPEDLWTYSVTPLSEWITLEDHEREYIGKVLAATDYNMGKASEILCLPRTTLWRKMKKYGFSKKRVALAED